MLSVSCVEDSPSDEQHQQDQRIDRVEDNQLLFKLEVHEEGDNQERLHGGDNYRNDGIHFAEIDSARGNGYDGKRDERGEDLVEGFNRHNVSEAFFGVLRPKRAVTEPFPFAVSVIPAHFETPVIPTFENILGGWMPFQPQQSSASSTAAASADEVEKREQINPNQVDQVPIKA